MSEYKEERPARENIDALLAEAAERRARMHNIQRQMREVETLIEKTDRRMNVIFIACFISLGLFGLLAFLVLVKDFLLGPAR